MGKEEKITKMDGRHSRKPTQWWHDIHKRMSSSELKFYFGVHSADGVDSQSYEVAQIFERHSVEKRDGKESAAASFSISAFGKNFDLDNLLPGDGILAPHAKVEIQQQNFAA